MKDTMLHLYCRASAFKHAVAQAAGEFLDPPVAAEEDDGMLVQVRPVSLGQAGMSRLAVIVIITAASVSIALLIVALLGEQIVALARRIADMIGGAPSATEDW